jgi:hypothetical protein
MAEDKKRAISTQRSSGFVQDLTVRFKLIFRLMGDNRVSPLIKLLPIGTLVYLINPFDIPGPIDDALVIWLGTYGFVELCPPDVVKEHMDSLTGVVASEWQEPIDDEDIIDAEYRVEE